MFTKKCFIRKNTQELRNKLSEIGYLESAFYCGDLSNLCVNVLGNGEYDESNDYAPLLCDAIDCWENEDLFLAIAALRDDTDKYQFITNGKIFMTCEKDDINEFVAIIYDGYHFENEEERKDALSNRWHKLTVGELIEHFK